MYAFSVLVSIAAFLGTATLAAPAPCHDSGILLVQVPTNFVQTCRCEIRAMQREDYLTVASCHGAGHYDGNHNCVVENPVLFANQCRNQGGQDQYFSQAVCNGNLCQCHARTGHWGAENQLTGVSCAAVHGNYNNNQCTLGDNAVQAFRQACVSGRPDYLRGVC